jgi:acyl-CoA reductase-like NAD-dependent aldehyde dehydrogenase
VCAAIVPFNFPAMVPFWFLPFAITCGNCFVLKVSEQVPLTQQIAFAELDALDLPPGVVNLVNGGREVVEGILDHPGIDDDVTPEMEIAREEVFGPVLAVIRAGSLDQAIEIVNASRFGNGTSIFTESGASVRRYRHEVQAGMIGVNIGVAAPVAFFPFSGWKDSFLSDLHAHGPDAVEFFTRKKTVTSRWFSSGQGSGTYFVER